MPRRKPIPPRTPDNLLPPNHEYEYFSGATAWPFRARANGFDRVNATWLADAALLAYADEGFVRAQWEAAGMATLRSFRGSSTQAYVATTPEWVIVAFRGTQVVKPLPGERDHPTWREMWCDWKTNADARLVPWVHGGAVHRGFKEALEQVWEDRADLSGLQSYLDDSGRAGRSVWFTGHSLGGALAILAAHAFGRAAGVYTFGAPRVGDRAFVESFLLPAYRVVNATDLVPRVPPKPYQAVGDLRYIGSDGVLAAAPGVLGRALDWIRGTLGGIVPGFSAFADHAPIYYATHLWNACVDGAAG